MWNLRRVWGKDFRSVQEVYYDDEGLPWTCSNARFRDIMRFWRDWMFSPPLMYPDDFKGKAPSLEGPWIPLEELNAG